MKKKLFLLVKLVAVSAFAVLIPVYAMAVTTYSVYITKAGTGGGTVTPSIGTITWTGNTGVTVDNATKADNSTTTVYFSVTPSLGSTYLGWSGCDEVSSDGTCTLSLTSDNKSLIVNFGGTSTYTLTVRKTGFGTGTIVPSSSTLTWDNTSTTATAVYNSNQTVALYQTPGSISRFSYWTGCDSVSDNGTCTIAMRSNATVTARFSGYHNVTYSFPYLHTLGSAVVYCVVSNFSTDNATGNGFTVMSSAQQSVSQTLHELPSAFTINRGKTAQIIFNNQQVAIKNDNLTVFNISDNNSLSIATDTCTNCPYGAKISWTSNLASMTSGVDCLSLVMSCFQGTTLPKRNLVGYLCSDDSTTGPGGKPNLIGY